jgi:hypothetical protein
MCFSECEIVANFALTGIFAGEDCRFLFFTGRFRGPFSGRVGCVLAHLGAGVECRLPVEDFDSCDAADQCAWQVARRADFFGTPFEVPYHLFVVTEGQCAVYFWQAVYRIRLRFAYRLVEKLLVNEFVFAFLVAGDEHRVDVHCGVGDDVEGLLVVHSKWDEGAEFEA